MILYLAASWSRQAEIRKISEELNGLEGIHVNSRWLEERTYSPTDRSHKDRFRRLRAEEDVADVAAADVLVRFTDDMSAKTVPVSLISGARMFEMGYAYALGKTIVVVGGHQPIFDYLPSIVHVKDLQELKKWIKENSRG